MSQTFPNQSGGDEPTYDDLYERAQELDIDGRSDMNKDELAAAVAEAEGSSTEGQQAPIVQPPTGTAPVPESGSARDLQTDPDTRLGPGQGGVIRAKQPDHTPDEDGFVGVDEVYRNASTQARRPATGEGDDAKVEEGSILKSAERRAAEDESDSEDE